MYNCGLSSRIPKALMDAVAESVSRSICVRPSVALGLSVGRRFGQSGRGQQVLKGFEKTDTNGRTE